MIGSTRPLYALPVTNDFLQYVHLIFCTATFELFVRNIGHLTARFPSANFFLSRKGLFTLEQVYPFKDSTVLSRRNTTKFSLILPLP